MKNIINKPASTELADALKAVKQHFIYAGIFSAAVNLLQLVPIIYMMQVYDRVIASGSLSTLGMLTLLLVALLIALGGFEWVRSYILIAASNRLELRLRERVFNATFKLALMGTKHGSQPISDLTGLRQFLTGNGIFAFFDAPWFPVYLAVMFMFNFWFGVTALIAGIVMVGLAFLNEMQTNERLKEANNAATLANAHLVGSLRNAEVIAAMGMGNAVRGKQQEISERVLRLQTDASKLAGGIGAVTKTFRVVTQSLILGLGALLALENMISPGAMIAGSLLLGRALAPIDMLVATWKGFSVARAQYDRLNNLLSQLPAERERMQLPAPVGNLSVEGVHVTPPGA
ncbi:MAG: ABC transporter transmembrane domain-containing protein, partial [Pseudomonadota bacterium]|nr:ABC transporter transmembrane domain-containing protein [Pseudomonadota bacterium]